LILKPVRKTRSSHNKKKIPSDKSKEILEYSRLIFLRLAGEGVSTFFPGERVAKVSQGHTLRLSG